MSILGRRVVYNDRDSRGRGGANWTDERQSTVSKGCAAYEAAFSVGLAFQGFPSIAN